MWFLMLALGGCGALDGPVDVETVRTANTSVPVTTSSSEARTRFDEGMVALDNFRGAEAIFELETALELDPGFAQAKAQLATLKPGKDGLALLVEANDAADSLPEAERMLIQSMLASARGEQAESNALLTKVAELAPGDWRVQKELGSVAYFQEDYATALTHLKRATVLSPEAGPAWNALGYTYAQTGDFDAAVASFDKYIALAPDEANPHDSKGEVLLQAGRFAEAEAAFIESTKVDPSFFNGWYGVAQTRFMQGDWEGGQQAVDSGRDAATRPIDKIGARTVRAWALAAQGNRAGAEATLVSAGDEAKARGIDNVYAFSSLTRGQVLLRLEAWADAALAFDEALVRLDEVGLEGELAEALRNQTAIGKAHASARRGEIDAARTTLDELSFKLRARPGLKNAITHLHGVVDLAAGYAEPGMATLSMCPNVAFDCRHDLAKAQAVAGRLGESKATLASLRARPWRDAGFLLVWTASGGAAQTEAPE